MSYHLTPTVSSDVSDVSKLNSPNTPCCLSVLLISLKKITGSLNGPAENHPGLALFIEPVTDVSVKA